MIFNDWYAVTIAALQGIWEGFLLFVPNLLGALIVLFLGWLASAFIAKWFAKFLAKVGFNKIFEKDSWRNGLAKANLGTNVSDFAGRILRWVLTLAFLSAAVEILGLYQFAAFLSGILGYLDNVVIAALIFVVTALVVDILVKIVVAASESANFGGSNIAGEIVRWSIWIFSGLIILHQLGVAPSLIEIFLNGLVMLIVVAGGLSFGLAGKDLAGDFLRDLRDRLRGTR